MINEVTDHEEQVNIVPFIFRFAQPIPPMQSSKIRYDTERQITQILMNGKWIDTLVADSWAEDRTKFTKVRAETTDDE